MTADLSLKIDTEMMAANLLTTNGGCHHCLVIAGGYSRDAFD